MNGNNNGIGIIGVGDINSALNMRGAILCRDIQSVVMITQLVRQQALDLVESGVIISDIKPTLNIIYPGEIEEISSVINHFKMQMLDILDEEQLDGIIFRGAKDINIGITFESIPLSLAPIKIASLGYDPDLGNFHLKSDKKSSKPIRSLIKESNRKFLKPRNARK